MVIASDGLPALEVAEHAKEKEFVLERIATIFNGGMRRKWDERYYVDLFTGPGLCRIKNTNSEIGGSALLATKISPTFSHYFLADMNLESLGSLEQRISALGLPDELFIRYYHNTADEAVTQIAKDLPPARSSLGLAVFDPWSWDFSFDTLAHLSQNRRLDIVVNFPIGYIKRNWEKELPRLDRFMNGSGYKARFRAAMGHETPGELPARILLDAYTGELQNIGYAYIRDRVFVANSRSLTLYCLLFASKNERGADFWDKVTQRQHSGQLRMPL